MHINVDIHIILPSGRVVVVFPLHEVEGRLCGDRVEVAVRIEF